MSTSKEVPPDVSVLIINYNGRRFLDECIASVKTAFSKYTFEILVVDNASQDGSQELLECRTDIRYIESKINLGFTGGNNLAASHAKGRILLLLNNDTKINSSLDPLISEASLSDTGAVGARLIYGDGRIQNSVGLDHHPVRLVFSWLGLEKKHYLPAIFRRVESSADFYKQNHPSVDWVSGACLATPHVLWEKLRGLDDSFFMYCEDVDYCLRVRKSGLRVSYVANTLVTHYEGAGRPWIGNAALNRTTRSYGLYLHKHYSRNVARVTSLALAAVFFMRSLAFRAQAVAQQIKSTNSDTAKDKSGAYLWACSLLIKQALQASSEALKH